jgi:hypothetical protein
MDCLRSFTLNINQNFVFSNTVYTEWNTTGAILPWTMFDGSISRNSVFNVQGFKNIDVYGITLVGNVYPLLAPANRQRLVEDWGVELNLNGNPPLIGGTFGNNSFALTLAQPNVFLTKYQNEYKLASPIKSVKDITVAALSASGIQVESGVSVDLTFDIALIVYYKFEGE